MHRFTFVCTFLWILKASDAKGIRVREGSTKELWCNGEMVLDIYFAKYEGRAIYCGRNDVTTSVQQQCNGLTSCQVSAKDEIYEDSCAFFNEVLTIRYGCVDSTLSTRTHDTTGSTTDHNRWHSSTTENDRRLSTATDDTSLKNTTSLEPHESALTNNHTSETITIATLIGGCIFGLLLIAVITITIFRHFRETKDIDAGDNVEILQINALSGSELDHHDHGSDRIDYVAETHLTNRDGILSNNSSTLLSMAYKNNSYTLEPTAVRNVSKTLESRNLTEDTRCKYTDDSEYSVIQNYSGDILPPSYDVLRECSSPTCLADCANKYNHANYNGNSYDKTNGSTPIQWSGDHNDGYSTAATFLLESDQCSPDNDSSEHVYENQPINYKDNKSLNLHKTSRQFGADHLSAEKKGINTPTKKCNPYDNINFTKSSRAAKTSKKTISNYQNIADNFSPTANYINVDESLSMENQAEDPNSHFSSPINRASSSQNVQNSEQNNNGQSQCYMPMNFGSSKKKTDFVESDNVYVPIMSPTTLVSPSDVFDDTYQF